MEIILTDTLTMTFCLFIVICFIVASIYLYKKTAPIAREIDSVNKALSAIKHKPEVDENGELVEVKWSPSLLTVMYQNYDQVDKLISVTASLKKQWRDYRRSMQEPVKDFTLSPTGAPILRNTIPTEKVFSFSEVLDTLINVRFLTSVPSKLTGLGLLFTFIGLIMGISEAAVGLGSDDIDAAKKALNPLLNGASIAFTTSVVGLSLAMVFSLMEKSRFHKLKIVLAEFGDLLNERVEFVDADKLASMQLQATQLQTKALTDFQFDQKRITNETITRVCQEFREALTESAGTELAHLGNIISQVTDRFETNLKGFENNQNIVQESTNKLAMQLDETINKLQHHATTNTEKFEASFARVTENFEESMQLSRNSLISGNEEIQLSTSQLVKQLDESTTKLQESSDKRANEIEGAFSRIDAGIEESMLKTSNKIRSMSVDVFSDLLVQLQDTSITTMDELIANTTAKLERSLAKITEGIHDTESPLKSLLEQIPVSVESMVKVNASVANSFNGLGKAQAAMDDILKGATNAAFELTQSSERLTDSNIQALEASEVYSQLISAVKNISESGTRSAASVEQSVAHLLKIFEEHRTHGDKLGIAMSSLFDDLEQGMLGYSAQTNKYMEGLDKHTSGISKHLVEAIGELRMTIADLNSDRLSEAL